MQSKTLKVGLLLVAAFALASCGAGGGGGGAIGDSCTTHSDCEGLCFDPGGTAESYCTDSCDRTAEQPCPEGFDCTQMDNIGYVCVQQAGSPLGDPCTDGADCRSGFCNTNVCSECEDNGDCAGGGTCTEDTDLGYWVCEGGTLGDLGDPCTDGADCTSTFCYTTGPQPDVCSECETNADCTQPQECTYDPGDGYASCTGGGPGALGDPCTTGADCASTFCYTTGPQPDVCSECETNADCTQPLECTYDAGDGYASCTGGGPGALGDPCTTGADCDSTFCYTTGPEPDVCSECETNADCTGEEQCTYDAGDGYASCTAGGAGQLGDSCTTGDDCDSGFCYVTTGPQPDICSECETNADCTAPQECSYEFGDQYAQCRGTADLGDACTANEECASGFCNTEVCSECLVNEDCTGGGMCTDETDTVGYFVCTGGLGDTCTEAADCGSGFCYDAMGPNDICSECAVDDDCTGGDTCEWSFPDGYATCQ